MLHVFAMMQQTTFYTYRPVYELWILVSAFLAFFLLVFFFTFLYFSILLFSFLFMERWRSIYRVMFQLYFVFSPMFIQIILLLGWGLEHILAGENPGVYTILYR